MSQYISTYTYVYFIPSSLKPDWAIALARHKGKLMIAAIVEAAKWLIASASWLIFNSTQLWSLTVYLNYTVYLYCSVNQPFTEIVHSIGLILIASSQIEWIESSQEEMLCVSCKCALWYGLQSLAIFQSFSQQIIPVSYLNFRFHFFNSFHLLIDCYCVCVCVCVPLSFNITRQWSLSTLELQNHHDHDLIKENFNYGDIFGPAPNLIKFINQIQWLN